MPTGEREPPASLELRRDLRALRTIEPTDGFEDRLGKALRDAERNQGKDSRPPPRGRRLTWATWAVLAQATVAAGFMLHFSVGGVPETDIERSQELDVQIPEAGHVWVPLRLETHHHEDGPSLRVHAPEGVEVSTHPVLVGAERRMVCRDTQCEHRFILPPPPHSDPHVRVGIRTPGTYEIHVAHHSDARAVRERFVVRASH